jgi:hypothetical protein
MDTLKIKKFFNRRVGGLGLGLILITAYVSLKWGLVGGVSPSFLWYSFWFSMLTLGAVGADIFSDDNIWIYNSLRKIEDDASLSPNDKMEMIRYHLGIAVRRHFSIFLRVGDTRGLDYLRMKVKRLLKGDVVVKELVVLVLYALYDLFLRGGALDIGHPWDILALLGGLVTLKVLDADKGFPGLVATMYEEAVNRDRAVREQLAVIEDYISQLGLLFNREFERAGAAP